MESSQYHRKSNAEVKGTRRRIRLLMVVLICFMAWAAVTLWDQLDKVNAKIGKLEMMEVKLEEAQASNEQYQREIIRYQDSEYIEQIIRRDLNMVKEGETLFIQTR